VHELGHALAAKAFGYSPTVQLMGLGGRTLPNTTEPIPWHREVLFTLAGPSAGLALGVLAGSVLLGLDAAQAGGVIALYALKAAFTANLFWALVNLIPVSPLDGGHIARAVLVHLFGRKGFLYAQLITLGFAAVGLALGLFFRAPVLGLLFALWGFRAVSVIQAWLRGELPDGGPTHPLQQQLDQAALDVKAGKLDEATRVAEQVLRAVDVPPGIKARAHSLLGLVAVKRSDGVEALRHFRTVEGLTVPPHALAAAHSLAGDDAAALPLWVEAANTNDDVLIRTELAGALLRLGREADAKTIAGVKLSHAWLAAERVLYLRGDYARAAQLAEGAFQAEPTAQNAFTAACNWARAKEPANALRCLTLAAQNGFTDAEAARQDPDLASLTGSPEFQAWLAGLPTR
jgi:Zn-dependent protease